MVSNLTSKGSISAQKIARKEIGLDWKIRNFPNYFRRAWKIAVAALLKIPTYYGDLEATLIKANGEKIYYGLISRAVVTDEFVAFIVDELETNTARFQAFDYHGSGTGSTAENAADTALVTEVESRATGTPSQPAANQYRSVGTVSYTGTRAIVEHGLFSASAPTDELMDRSVFTAINVVNGDSIQFTYTITFTSGG